VCCAFCDLCDQGLSILLNTCNLRTADKYTEFADHVTCVSLKREEAVPVVNRRSVCLCLSIFVLLCVSDLISYLFCVSNVNVVICSTQLSFYTCCLFVC